MTQRLIKLICRLLYIVLYGLVSYLTTERKRINHHTHRVRHLEVITAVGNGGDTQLVVISEARQGIEYSGQGQTGRGDLDLVSQLRHRLHIQRSIHLSHHTILRIGDVFHYFCNTFHLCQLGMEEVSCLCILFALFSHLLVCH